MKIFNQSRAGSSQRGDTIIEVLVSMAILALVLTVTYVSSSSSLHNGTDSSNRQQAIALAEQQVELIKSTPPCQGLASDPPSCTGTFCVDNTGNLQAVASPKCHLGVNSQYTLTDSYTSDGSLYKVTATWPSSHFGGSQLVVYYRLPPTPTPPATP